MADIAQIGFQANTGALVDVKNKLDALPPAAARVDKATDSLAASMGAVSAAAAGVSASTSKTATALDHQTTQTQKAAAANDNLARSYRAVETAQQRINRTTGVDIGIGRSAKESAAFFSELENLRKQFNPLFAVIRQYKGNVEEIRRANQMGALSVKEMTVALRDQRQAALMSIAAIKGNSSMVHQYGRTANVASFNVANLAAQFQDIGVTAAMGMNPLQIALQQGTQISAILGPMGAAGALGTLKTAFLSIISPVSLVVIALVGLTVAGLQLINWTKLGKSVLYGLADAIEALAIPLTIVAAGFALAFAPTILTAIGNITVAIAVGLYGAIASVIGLIGIIPSLFIAAVVGVSVFSEEIAKMIGPEMVENIKSVLNWVISSIFETYNAIKTLFVNIPNAVSGAAVGAANAAIAIVDWIIKKAVEGINILIRGVNSVKALAGGMLGGAIDEIKFDGLGKFDNKGAEAFFNNMDALAKENGAIAARQWVDEFGNVISSTGKAIGSSLRSVADGLGSDSGKAAKRYADIVTGAKNTIEALKAEQATIGMGEFAASKLRHETELLNQAREKGINLTIAQRAELSGLATDMASLEYATKKQRELFDFAKDATKGFISDLRQGLQEGKNFWDAFGDSVLNVLNKITDKLLNDVVDALFEVNSAGGGKGGLGSTILSGFSSIFGAGGDVGMNSWNSGTSISGLGFAKGGAFTNSIVNRPTAFSFAKGTALGEMGEAGPEAVMPLSRGPDGSLGVQMHGANDNSGDAPAVYVDIIIQGDANATVREERSTNSNGDQFRSYIVETNKQAMANGEFDNVNSARYNNKPSRVIR